MRRLPELKSRESQRPLCYVSITFSDECVKRVVQTAPAPISEGSAHEHPNPGGGSKVSARREDSPDATGRPRSRVHSANDHRTRGFPRSYYWCNTVGKYMDRCG